MGQTHTQKYMPRLLEAIMSEEIDPTFIITDRISLDDAPEAYSEFAAKKDGCVKVVMQAQAP